MEIKLLPRVRVVLQSALTYLILAQTVLTLIISEGVLDAWPDVVEVLIVLTGVFGVIILAIRRVTPVEPEDRGLLP